jgi:D-ribose pyranose/furanose isomerase RbsD
MKRIALALPLPVWLLVGIGTSLMLSSCTSANPSGAFEEDATWQATLEHDLPLLGHRNWILVVDKAFPEQSSPGMKYLYVEQELLPTLEYVLEKVEASSHVKPVIYRDRELSYITEEQVGGIEAFRSEAEKVLADREVHTLLHEEVFTMLDESSSLFRVLVIKTNATLPYTSVFLQLDCAYWNAEQEQALREAMQ